MILTALTEEKITERLLSLPEDLKVALDDADIRARVDSIGTKVDLSEELIPILETLVSLVFMGFVKTESLPGELQEMLALTPEEAAVVTSEISNEVLQPYLSSISKSNTPSSVPSAPSPATSPTLNLRVAPAPLPTVGASFEVRDASTSSVPKPTMPAPTLAPNTSHPAPSATPTPFILQKGAAGESVVKDSGFRLNLDPKLFGGGPSRPVVPAPPKAARLELGATPAPRPQAPLDTTPTPTARVVHYTAPQNITGIKAAPLPQTAEPGTKNLEPGVVPNSGIPTAVPAKFNVQSSNIPANMPPAAKPTMPAPTLAPSTLHPASKSVPTLDLRPHPAVKPEPPAGLPVTSAHPLELDLRKEDKIANNSQFSTTNS